MGESNTPGPGTAAWTDRARSSAGGVAVMLLIPLVFFASMVFQGKEPPAADTGAARAYSSWGDSYERSTGQFPDWFPGIFGGLPSYGSFTYAPRSPIHPLAWVQRAFADNRGLWYVLLLAIAGWSTYAFLRRQGFSRLGSTTAALLYAMTPYFVGCIAAGHSTKLEALALLPLFLWAVDLVLERPGLWQTAVLAFVAAALAWTNHPQVAYYACIIAVLYAAARLVQDRGSQPDKSYGLSLGLSVVGAVALTLLLAAEPFWAVREYAPWSIRGAAAAGSGEGGAGVGWDYATAWSFHPRELVSFLVPGWFGLEGGTYWGPMPFTHSTHYFGILTLLLALFGLWRMRSPRRWIWAAISVVILLIGFGRHFPVLFGPMFRLLPLFDKFRVPSMIYGVLPFCLAFLVAGGIDELLRLLRGEGDPASGGGGGARAAGVSKRKERGARPVSRGTARLFLVSGGVALALWIILGLGARGVAGGGSDFVRPGEATQLTAQVLAALRAERLTILELSLAQSMLAVIVASAALAWGAADGRRRAGWAGAIVAIVAVGDILLVNRQFYHVEPKVEARASVPLRGACEFLAGQPGTFRILPAARELFSSNAYATLGLESVGGYHPAKLRAYQDLVDAGLLSQPSVLKMLNVRYVLSPTPIRWEVPAVYQSDGWVYPLPDSLPRAWSVTEVETESGFEAVRTKLADGAFDPARTALVYAGDAPSGASFAPARVTFSERGVGRLRLAVEASGPSFVVVSEPAFPPGWKATVDGRPVSIHRVNHLLQGVEVPAGEHQLEFTMRSSARVTGARVSRAAGALVLLLGAFGYYRSRRRAGAGAADHQGSAAK